MEIKHSSGCAVHNAPAMEPGPCDCGALLDPASTDSSILAGPGPLVAYPTDWDVRNSALHIAKEARLPHSTTEDIIAAAKTFEAYLKG